jgi:tRNA-dihydrouridine synthase
MEGITGWLYRDVHHRCFPGVDKYFMPFLSVSQDHVFPRRELQDILPTHNEGVPAVPQLLTRRAEDFLWAAGKLAAMGYREVN